MANIALLLIVNGIFLPCNAIREFSPDFWRPAGSEEEMGNFCSEEKNEEHIYNLLYIIIFMLTLVLIAEAFIIFNVANFSQQKKKENLSDKRGKKCTFYLKE